MASKGTYIHGDENTVGYYIHHVHENGMQMYGLFDTIFFLLTTSPCRFQETSPHTFQIGDLVEAQLSFIVIPL
jgi:hypothetical protein